MQNWRRAWKLSFKAATLRGAAMKHRDDTVRGLFATLLVLAPLLHAEDNLLLKQPLAGTEVNEMPNHCISYAERYSGYLKPPPAYWHPNAQNPGARKVVVVKAHTDMRWENDTLLAMRALAGESAAAGYHFYILLHVRRPLDLKHSAKDWGNFTEAREKLPEELVPWVAYFDDWTLLKAYRGAFDREAPTLTGYLQLVWFLQRHPQYDFAWEMEHDVRYLGRWNLFFEAAVSFSYRYAYDYSSYIYSELKNGSRGFLDNYDSNALPDLITFDNIHRSGKMGGPAYTLNWHNVPFDRRMATFSMLLGWSRRLINIVHYYSKGGLHGASEVFPTTVAYLNDLPMVFVPHDVYVLSRHQHHLSTYTADGGSSITGVFYRQWRDSGQCHNATLLHPVKAEHPVLKLDALSQPRPTASPAPET